MTVSRREGLVMLAKVREKLCAQWSSEVLKGVMEDSIWPWKDSMALTGSSIGKGRLEKR